MGYYDGLGGIRTKASSYDLARVTDTPVILIVNAKGMSLSILAQIKGFLDYQKDSKIKGVILNQTSEMTCRMLTPKIESELGICVFGYVPKNCRLASGESSSRAGTPGRDQRFKRADAASGGYSGENAGY